jgi:hypothetical protein
MFTQLLDSLSREFSGTEMYLPDALYDMVKDWFCRKHDKEPGNVVSFRYKGKFVKPYDETRVLRAYQACPIVVPERILEKTYIIECSIGDTQQQPEPVKETTQQQKPKATDDNHFELPPRASTWGL